MEKLRRWIWFSTGLGLLSIPALAFSHLALTDIWHGEGDLALEWNVLRVAFLILTTFLAISLLTLFRALRIIRNRVPSGATLFS